MADAAARRTASPKTHDTIDWVAGHGPVSAAVAVATTATATASLGAWAQMPSGWPLLIGVAGAAAHGIGVGIRRRLSRPTLAVRAASWLAASGWTSAAIATDPATWTEGAWWAALGSLTAIGLGIGAGLVRAEVHEEALDDSRRALDAAMAEARLARADWEIVTRWVALIRSVAQVEVTPAGFDRRPNDSGFALEVTLPIGYASVRLQAYATSLAESARLPAGCLVTITPAGKQGHVVLDVDTVDTSAVSSEFPGDWSPLSVLGGLPWGVSRTGDQIEVHMREACALIVGPPGSAKTTLLDSIIATFTRCTDVLVCGIDVGKTGDAFAPWITPWAEGQGIVPPLPGHPRLPDSTRPAVDWVAAGMTEAERLLDALLAIGTVRLTAYRDLMRRMDTKLLPISADIPMIFCIIDEGAEILAYTGSDPVQKRVREKILKVMRTLRAMGIRLILTATDGNLTSLGDSSVRKYSPVRVALTATDPEGAGVAKLFGSVKGLDAKQLRAKGAGVIGAGTDPGFSPTPMRTWVTAPSLARDAVLATQARWPRLDAPSAQAAGDSYRDRWTPARVTWITNPDGVDQAAAATPTNPAAPTTGPVSDLRSRLRIKGQETPTTSPAPQDADAEKLIAQFRASLEKLGDAPEPTREDEQDRYNGIPGLKVRGASTEPEPEPEDWKGSALQIIRDAGPEKWLSTSEIRAHLTERDIEIGRSALSTELGQMVRRGEIRQRGTGPQTRYSALHTE